MVIGKSGERSYSECIQKLYPTRFAMYEKYENRWNQGLYGLWLEQLGEQNAPCNEGNTGP